MNTALSLSLSLSLSVAVLTLGGDIPHGKDETTIVRIQADPHKHVGKDIVICGGIAVSDYYNHAYGAADKTHYSIRFREVGKTFEDIRGEPCYLYLKKDTGKKAMDDLLARSEDVGDPSILHVARISVYLDKRRFEKGKQWNMMEVIDIQFLGPEGLWKPWIVEPDKAAQAKKARDSADVKAYFEGKAKLAAEEAETARLVAAALRRAKFEALQWRDWISPTGQKIEVKYGGINSGQLKLITRKGVIFKVPVNKLSKEELEWIQQKPWVGPKATKKD